MLRNCDSCQGPSEGPIRLHTRLCGVIVCFNPHNQPHEKRWLDGDAGVQRSRVTFLASETREGSPERLLTCRHKSYLSTANKQEGLECRVSGYPPAGRGEPKTVSSRESRVHGEVSVLEARSGSSVGAG